jgi:hypothetical protein
MPKKEKDKIDRILTEVQHIRRGQILSSLDSVFMIGLPVLTLLVNFVISGIYIGIFLPVLIILIGSLTFGILGILRDSIQDRLLGWWLLLGNLIFAYTFYTLVHEFSGVTGSNSLLVWVFGSFMFGSLLLGIWLGELVFHFVFLKKFLSRMRKAGTIVTPHELLKKTKMISVFGIVGAALIVLGIVLIYLKPI